MVRRALVPTLAVLVTGLALYVTGGVLDQVVTGSRAVRVAMLPPWQALAGFMALAGLALLCLAHGDPARGATATNVQSRRSSLTLPAFGLVLLLLPYLPLLPDWIPALQLLAGPLRWIVWLTVAGLATWAIAGTRPVIVDWLQGRSIGRLTLIIGLLTAAASGAAACRLSGTVSPAGDEPHYLVIAQSLWRDGDLRIENNHTRGDYREYYPRDLDPHFLTRGADGEIYSIHPIGLPLLIAPVYGVGGYRAVVLALILAAAAASALMWRSVVRATNAPGAATFAWAAIALTTPFLYNTFTVYPEILAALAAVLALTRASDAEAWPRGHRRWLVVGVAAAALPWLSTKYAPMSAALVLIAVGRIWIPHPLRPVREEQQADESRPATRSTALALAAVLGPYLVSLTGWFATFYLIWGSPLPQAPYGNLVQTDVKNLIFGAPGLLFDQEYGLLAYAPVYILAATGLWQMWREEGALRRRAVEIALACGALLATVGAFRIWWGGSASPGRPVASGLLLLALPIAFASRGAASGSARRAGHHVLLWVSIGIAATLAVAQEGSLISNQRDGTSSLLEYLSPRWEAWGLAPTFVHHEAPTALVHSVAWLAIAAMAAAALSRWRTATRGGAALAAVVTLTLALLTVVILMPILPADPPLPRVDLRARPRLALLDGYDVVTRPVAMRYDPLHMVSATSISTLAWLEVEPGTHVDPQPVRVLHNGRLSLPAGRYRIDIRWADEPSGPELLALQIGRTGGAWRSWTVDPEPGGRWDTEFALPVDASFVGLRGSPELERAIAGFTFTPLSVLDASARPNLPMVLSAMQLGDIAVFFHDENYFPERTGFWVKGEREARITVARPSTATPLVLQIHSGAMAARVRLSAKGWQRTIDLQRLVPQEITLPELEGLVLTLGVAVENGFRPSDLDSSSTDHRLLGAWIEFLPVKGQRP